MGGNFFSKGTPLESWGEYESEVDLCGGIDFSQPMKILSTFHRNQCGNFNSALKADSTEGMNIRMMWGKEIHGRHTLTL